MINEKNLIPNSQRTPDELREITSKGGIASGKARRRKKTMREQLEMLLSMPFKDSEAMAAMERSGINPKDADNQMAMNFAMWQKAIGGDVQAYNTIRDLIGEKPVENINVIANMDDKVAEIEGYIARKKKDAE